MYKKKKKRRLNHCYGYNCKVFNDEKMKYHIFGGLNKKNAKQF